MNLKSTLAGDLKNETRANTGDICLREKTDITDLWQ
mgnify:CR=1 FL=1